MDNMQSQVESGYVEILPAFEEWIDAVDVREVWAEGEFAERLRARIDEALDARAGDARLDLDRATDLTVLRPADSAFDAIRCESPFLHLPEIDEVVADLARALRTGGRLVIVETDWSTLSLVSSRPGLARRLSQFKADATRRSGYDAANLRRAMAMAGLTGIEIESHCFHTTSLATAQAVLDLDLVEDAAIAQGVLSAADVACLHDDLVALDAGGGFRAFVDVLIVRALRR